MESEWVRVAPYLGISLPETAVNDDFPGVLESKEVYKYFLESNPFAPIQTFIDFYTSLPETPKFGQSKMGQIIEALRLMKLADKVQAQMNDLGIKR